MAVPFHSDTMPSIESQSSNNVYFFNVNLHLCKKKQKKEKWKKWIWKKWNNINRNNNEEAGRCELNLIEKLYI